MATKLTKLDEAASFAGPVALGVDTPPPETPPAVVTITENELPVAATAAAIAHLRAVNAEGESVIATPRQFCEMVGIDYSSLEEQEVPGEFAPDRNGVRKQVYTKTYIGTTPTTTPQYSAHLLDRISNSMLVVKTFGSYYVGGNWYHNYTAILAGQYGDITMIVDTANKLNMKYIITIQYVK